MTSRRDSKHLAKSRLFIGEKSLLWERGKKKVKGVRRAGDRPRAGVTS